MWIPARICVSELGDTTPDQLVERGVVEDIMLAPMSRREVMNQIDRILSDRLRGIDALSHASPRSPSQYPDFLGKRILAADDSAVNREVVKEALALLNFNVTLAVDGCDALQRAKDEHFDLILMDCSMPNMDGYEATQAIRTFEKNNDRPRTPILALTAHVAGTESDWRNAGMDDYLTKPFTLNSLERAIGKYLPQTTAAKITETSAYAPNKPTPATKDGAFDLSVLDQIAAMQSPGGDLPFRTLKLFEHHSLEAMQTLAESIKAGDGEAIAKAAHSLKSMSVNVGASLVGAACSKIEKEARAGANPDVISTLYNTATQHFRVTHKALPALLADLQKSVA